MEKDLIPAVVVVDAAATFTSCLSLDWDNEENETNEKKG